MHFFVRDIMKEEDIMEFNPSDNNGTEKKTKSKHNDEKREHEKRLSTSPGEYKNKKEENIIKKTYTRRTKLSDGVNMMTKTFESKELLPFSQLRTLNQKELLQSLVEHDKLGIVIKDQLKVAMIDMERYEQLVDALQDYERLLELMDEQEEYGRILHRFESNRVVEYKEGMSLLDLAGVHRKKG